MEITLNLPEKIYRNVSTVAKKSKREVVDLIVDVVEEKYSSNEIAKSFSDFSDEEVLALANLQMPEKQSERHSELLYKNQAGTLTAERKTRTGFSFSKFTGLLLQEKRTEFLKRLSAI